MKYIIMIYFFKFEWKVTISGSESLGNFILATYKPIFLHSILSKLLKTTVALASAEQLRQWKIDFSAPKFHLMKNNSTARMPNVKDGKTKTK